MQLHDIIQIHDDDVWLLMIITASCKVGFSRARSPDLARIDPHLEADSEDDLAPLSEAQVAAYSVREEDVEEGDSAFQKRFLQWWLDVKALEVQTIENNLGRSTPFRLSFSCTSCFTVTAL